MHPARVRQRWLRDDLEQDRGLGHRFRACSRNPREQSAR